MAGLSIGKVKVENPLVLAPMAAVNCPAFRLLCRNYGAGLIYSPMIHCNSVTHLWKVDKDRVFENFINFQDGERPLAAQIVGSDPKLMGESARILSDFADIIDLNFGCCDSDILAAKAGAFFVKHPEQMDKVLDAVLDSTDLPVTAKIRIGWDERSVNAVDVCRKLEGFGLAAVAVHARTRKQAFSGKANWSVIKEVKASVNIPVIGNGDVFLPGSAKAMLDQTNCDFVMIGRAAIGNPFIFSRAKFLLENGSSAPEQSRKDVKKCFFEFVKLYGLQKRQKFSELRDQALWFVKGLDGARKLKQDILGVKDKDKLLGYLEEVL